MTSDAAATFLGRTRADGDGRADVFSAPRRRPAGIDVGAFNVTPLNDYIHEAHETIPSAWKGP